MNKPILILFVSLLICLSISPVLAYDYSGTFNFTSPQIIETYSLVLIGPVANHLINGITATQIELYPDLRYMYLASPWTDYNWDTGIQSASSSVIVKSGATTIGTGTMGFNNNSANGKIQIWIAFDTWDLQGLTGAKLLSITGIPGNISSGSVSTAANPTRIAFGETAAADGRFIGDYTTRSYFKFLSSWTANAVGYMNTVTVEKYTNSSMVRIYKSESEIVDQEGSINAGDYSLTTIQFPLKISVVDIRGYFHNTSYMFAGGNIYSIALDATEITPTGSTTGLISSETDPMFAGISSIAWKWSDSTGTYSFYESGNMSRPLDYNLQSGVWYGFDKLANTYKTNMGATFPNPVTLSGITSTGTKTVICTVFTSDGNYYTLTATLNVGAEAGASGRVLVRAIDWRTNDQVAGAAINIKNLGSNTWSNETTITGRREYFTPIGSRLYLEAYKSGYDRASIPMYLVEGLMDSQTITMFPTGSGSSGIVNTTLYVSTYDGKTYDLRRGVTVTIRNDGQVKVTDNSGTVSFTVANGTAYTVRAGCSANDCTSQIKTETVSGSAYSMQFYLDSLYVTTAPTLAPGQTALPTAVATVDVRTNEQKGEGMTKILYDNGETIVTLCVFVTIASLLGFKFGK